MSEPWPQPERIAAILPCYSQTGDTTTIISTDGITNTTKFHIKTVIRKIALTRSTDLVALKRHTACATQRAILQPLPLTAGLILCPVKVRIPRITGDTSTGYINYYAIRGVEKHDKTPYQAIISLAGGIKVPVLWTTTTVKRHLQDARLALAYSQQHPAAAGIREGVTAYAPEIVPIIQKFVEVICDIVAAKQR